MGTANQMVIHLEITILLSSFGNKEGKRQMFVFLGVWFELTYLTPHEPEKIARYLVLSVQKRQKIGGQKEMT